ncbi:DUF6817 domain-containing protein [Spirillospora sp. NPDC049024]
MTTEQNDRVASEAEAAELLRAKRADLIQHPGGTLLEHLHRVHALLGAWGARRTLRLAGLCHAFYGTDGFPVALGSFDRREELSAIVGTETESLVHLYASCDRASTYPTLHRPDGAPPKHTRRRKVVRRQAGADARPDP